MRIDDTNEELAAKAFTRQSAVFDQLYNGDPVIQYKRHRVRDHLLAHVAPGCSILELNAGTGEDAVYLAGKGYRVHATDISSGMITQLKNKITHGVTCEVCSFTRLDNLDNKGPYDCIFSNFAGLNCTGDLEKVLTHFEGLLKPGGVVVLVLLPSFCLWETLLMFRGKFKTATRRFFSAKGRKANVEGTSFRCWYYSPRSVIRTLKQQFKVMDVEGLCIIVPPSYIDGFAGKYSRAFSFLCKMEERLKKKWPWRSIGDYYIISLKKR